MALAELSLLSSILLLGDSHLAGQMGRHLVQLIETHSPTTRISVDSSCGATPNTFFNQGISQCGTWQSIPTLPTLDTTHPTRAINLTQAIRLSKAEHIVISLGTNLATRCNHAPCYKDDEIREQVKKMVNEIHAAHISCSWILIPPVRLLDRNRVNALIRDVASSDCQMIAAPYGLHYPVKAGDGIHYSGRAALQWSEGIFEQLTN